MSPSGASGKRLHSHSQNSGNFHFSHVHNLYLLKFMYLAVTYLFLLSIYLSVLYCESDTTCLAWSLNDDKSFNSSKRSVRIININNISSDNNTNTYVYLVVTVATGGLCITAAAGSDCLRLCVSTVRRRMQKKKKKMMMMMVGALGMKRCRNQTTERLNSQLHSAEQHTHTIKMLDELNSSPGLGWSD